ncbi:hypothetical protein B0A52_08902 [Exophiala mesophila]|uniref:Sas10 C-terminal domain-containing protein n=1 Tax=Exophiala mesophila TaxID=212818 RepID=A0A438MUZ7_EXOME|nr:hypothetical protein B0A52_08902 [Exophiala mesophila]
MARKRKSDKTSGPPRSTSDPDPLDHFDDSEDEFYAGRDQILLADEPAAKRQKLLQEQEHDLQPSDEEVYDASQGAGSDQDDQENEEEEEQEERVWGSSKADYYNADAIETEIDALEEEAEATRLQQKQLNGMTDADFGFDQAKWIDDKEPPQPQQRPRTVEKLPELKIPTDATPDEQLRILTTRYPEFNPLTTDFRELQQKYSQLKEAAGLSLENSRDYLSEAPPVAVTQFRALSAYLAAVAMYLAILTSSKSGVALPPTELRDHPVMINLLRCRQLWQDTEVLKPLGEPVTSGQSPLVASGESKATATPQDATITRQKQRKNGNKRLKATKVLPSPSPTPPPKTSDSIVVRPKRPRKTKRNELQDLVNTTLQHATTDADSDFGDETPLTREEAEEKAKRKRSLRFYTSQIAQKANKRGAASRQAGGDDDVPHKERLRDRQDRLLREAADRGRANPQANEALDPHDEDDFDDEHMLSNNRVDDDDDDYYNTLVSNSKQKKQDKAARAAAFTEAAKQGAQVYEEEQIGDDGKRKITYAIEKNKGLAPKRNKDVRNPRVKKRKKYDEKMKKLSSMRQVYKGGEGKGGYGGELTGIKTNLVKSVKL